MDEELQRQHQSQILASWSDSEDVKKSHGLQVPQKEVACKTLEEMVTHEEELAHKTLEDRHVKGKRITLEIQESEDFMNERINTIRDGLKFIQLSCASRGMDTLIALFGEFAASNKSSELWKWTVATKTPISVIPEPRHDRESVKRAQEALMLRQKRIVRVKARQHVK